MIRKVVINRFKRFELLEFELPERAVIAGPNNSGKSTLLQALAIWAELGELWLESNADRVRADDGSFPRVEIDKANLGTLALASFDELWHNQETRVPITIQVETDRWNVGFELHYHDPTMAKIGPMTEVMENCLDEYGDHPLKALYIPSLSGLDVHEPEYGNKVLATRVAQGRSGTVIRNMVQVASRDFDKWQALQNTVQSFFGYELSMPSGVDPIMLRYRHSSKEGWYDLINGGSGFLQTILLQSALLYSDATLFLFDEPDAHLHALLKEKVYSLLREDCDKRNCQSVIATHSGRLIEEADREHGGKLFLVTSSGLNPVRQQDAKEMLKIPAEQIAHAESMQCVLYVEGKTDLDILRKWARVLNHPAARYLDGVFWVSTAEREQKKGFCQRHFRALKALVPTLTGLEIRDRNGGQENLDEKFVPGVLAIAKGKRNIPNGLKRVTWSRYEIENYLIHPKTILRFVSQSLDQQAVDQAKSYMEGHLFPAIFDDPFEVTDIDKVKGKRLIERILGVSGLEIGYAEYYKIAACMTAEEVHPDVVAMLKLMEDRLGQQGATGK